MDARSCGMRSQAGCSWVTQSIGCRSEPAPLYLSNTGFAGPGPNGTYAPGPAPGPMAGPAFTHGAAPWEVSGWALLLLLAASAANGGNQLGAVLQHPFAFLVLQCWPLCMPAHYCQCWGY